MRKEQVLAYKPNKRFNPVFQSAEDPRVAFVDKNTGASYRSVRKELLTREQEIEIAQNIERGIVAYHLLRKHDPININQSIEGVILDRVAAESEDTKTPEFRNKVDGNLSDLRKNLVIEDLFPEINENELSEKDLEELKKMVARAKESRDQAVEHNHGLVVETAKFYYRKKGSLTMDDLIQIGKLGFLKGLARFDWRSGNKFSTYIPHWVKHMITEAIGKDGSIIALPSHRIDWERVYEKAYDFLLDKMGQPPTDSETAQFLEWPLSRIELIKSAPKANISLEAPKYVKGKEPVAIGSMIEDPNDNDNPILYANHAGLVRDLEIALKSLNPRWRKILMMRSGIGYDHEYTLEEVGKEFGVTRERIRQIEAQAQEKISKKFSHLQNHLWND
ncbi:sigma-70 family RNA polymerase sigma factor [Candidatus Microgenomates bacterium]|nr:sigma-70 family RNA polymerase sigma factor [Candidatus Microgenomates bacterium]